MLIYLNRPQSYYKPSEKQNIFIFLFRGVAQFQTCKASMRECARTFAWFWWLTPKKFNILGCNLYIVHPCHHIYIRFFIIGLYTSVSTETGMFSQVRLECLCLPKTQMNSIGRCYCLDATKRAYGREQTRVWSRPNAHSQATRHTRAPFSRLNLLQSPT